ncbi:RraA family protein [Streptomyces sp. ODS05-4]|uniref:RraA family protein n=1 Tax=Streptomyces sp. ODS05-4 TaxID=2944939 RepID=UPI00210D9139|nr:RraA family protein [Streptomyces sp. ODS05-4]
MTHEARTAWTGISTATVSDALDLLDQTGCLAGIRRLSGTGLVVGPAYTLSYHPVTEPGTGTVGDFVDEVPPGSVIVIDNAGRTECTVWGEILSEVAAVRKIAGVVIDGVCRDIERTRELGFPIWARGVYMRTGKGRVTLAARQAPITVAGVLVRPGDLVCADDSGALVVARGAEEQTREAAARIAASEEGIVEAVRRGVPLATARRDFGYHAIRPGPGEDGGPA